MKRNEPGYIVEKYVSKDFEGWYVPHMFEEICRQYLIRQNLKGELEAPFHKIGKYWCDNPETRINGEFDTVTEDSNGCIFYEIKFRKEAITESMIEEEIVQVKRSGLNCYGYGLFSYSGFLMKPQEQLILT